MPEGKSWSLQEFIDSERPRVLCLDEIPASEMTGRKHYARSFVHAADIVIEDGRIIKDRAIPDIDRDSMIGLPPTEEQARRAFMLTPEISRRQVASMKAWVGAITQAMIAGRAQR